ncbi:unnamed protein product [Miscanthus lutarioriparius]|uniref:Uncharacterized protein n=1 Tax=Miscanthus lutarioriparius TaxID=422564 RepID=A0A811PMR2_9POAL|nr:unnamed protein product [Miscanthus lutarioriparius]
MEENDDSTLGLGHSSQADELPAAVFEDPVACAPSSTSFEPSTEVGSSDESKCQDAHDLGYLTFNPLFSQTACLTNIQEESSSSGQKLGSRIVLASLRSEYLKVDPEKSGASKNVPIINRSRKASKVKWSPFFVMSCSDDGFQQQVSKEMKFGTGIWTSGHDKKEKKTTPTKIVALSKF